jgi:LCP family protein required for cell wall assembly
MSTSPQLQKWPADAPQRAPLSAWTRLTLLLALILFVAGGLLFGYIFYASVRERMAQPLNPVEAAVPVLPESNASAPAALPAAPSTSGSTAPTASGPKERINILLMGIDQRDAEAGQPTRTDTMILLTIDPVGKTMGLLSIPRDLWVPIPGLSHPLTERINTANFYGDLENYPGGGPALAKKTVQYNLGIPVHYYVRIDFNGFQKIVDALGGVTIDVDKPIHDDQYPDANYGVITIDIPAGVQHMDGKTALEFVRTRHVDSDFGRTRRQLQFLVAMRDQALNLNILPKLPSLISQFRDSVKTDLTANEIINLARLASQVDKDQIITRSIDETMVTGWVTPEGGEVLIPNRDEIKKVVDEVFAPVAQAPNPQPTPVPTATPAPEQPTASSLSVLQSENARIEVLNGTNTKGLATRTSTYLRSLGYNVVAIGDAGRYDYQTSVILSYADKKYTQSALTQLFNVLPENVRKAPSARMDVDIRLILGADAPVP